MISLNDLERGEALDILRKILLPRYNRRFRKHLSVLSVCIGLKLKREKEIKSESHGLCLKVIVHRKGIFNEKEDIPAEIFFNHPVHGKIRVETDVEDVGKLTLNSGRVLSPKLEAGGLTGSIACALAHSQKKRFLLTARHVLDEVDGGENNVKVTWSKAGLTGEGTYNNASNWYFDKDPTNKQSGYVDVGLVDMANISNDAIYYPGSDKIPHLDSTVDWTQCEDHDLVRICGYHQDVYAKYSGQLATGTQIFIDGQGVPYWRMITYFLDQDNMTREGDSGAAVIDEKTETLVGIHLGLRETNHGYCAIALCSGDILSFLKARLGGEFKIIS